MKFCQTKRYFFCSPFWSTENIAFDLHPRSICRKLQLWDFTLSWIWHVPIQPWKLFWMHRDYRITFIIFSVKTFEFILKKDTLQNMVRDSEEETWSNAFSHFSHITVSTTRRIRAHFCGANLHTPHWNESVPCRSDTLTNPRTKWFSFPHLSRRVTRTKPTRDSWLRSWVRNC